MPQHSYKQLEEAYQRGVNKEHNAPHVIPSRVGMPRDANNPNQASTVFT